MASFDGAKEVGALPLHFNDLFLDGTFLDLLLWLSLRFPITAILSMQILFQCGLLRLRKYICLLVTNNEKSKCNSTPWGCFWLGVFRVFLEPF